MIIWYYLIIFLSTMVVIKSSITAICGPRNGGATVTLLEVRPIFRQVICYALTWIIGSAGDWQDDGVCTTAALAPGQFVTAHYESKSVPLSVPVKTPGVKHSRFFKLDK